MYEELFVIKDGQRYQLDLNTPSGITLNFKSNLFGDLSKITASYTYTFKLPMSRNNRQILDSAEDIRYESGMIRKRLKAEFWQNGVNLFANANLYISEITNTYSAVLTWNVNDALEKLKDDDIDLNELPNTYGLMCNLRGGVGTTAEEEFSNTAEVLYPMYNCGMPYYMFDTKIYERRGANGVPSPIFTTGFGCKPMPVVPVYHLLLRIQNYYGIKCNIGETITKGEFLPTTKEDDIITRGVIPLVGIDLDDDDLDKFTCNLYSPSIQNINEKIFDNEIQSMISFGSITVGNASSPVTGDSEYFGRSKTILYKDNYATGVGCTTIERTCVCPLLENMKFELDGCLRITVDSTEKYDSDNPPTIAVYQFQNEYVATVGGRAGGGGTNGRRINRVWKEICSIEGEATGATREYIFDFASINGKNRLECSNCQPEYPISIQFNYKAASIAADVRVTAHLVNTDSCTAARPISLYYNLPDISCLTFLKALFFMIGAYPLANEAGEIEPHYFSDIKRNLESGKTVDWSNKDTTAPGESPNSIKFAVSEFAQRNYYLMKSDNLDETENDKKDKTDIYASGIGCLLVGSEVIDKDKTIIQLPFYAPYIKNKKFPSYATGDTMKVWEPDDGDLPAWTRPGSVKLLKFNAPKPCYGVIVNQPRTFTYNGTVEDYSPVMSMRVWNGFTQLDGNESFQYLQSIISKPYIVTIELRLNEFDLRDLDYSVPVYLEKYNSYFAIVSIQRDSKGKCKCELIKLP